jgi:hypothetical protein
VTEGALLQRIARILRQDIGPAVADEYARTQAFMAAVVLEKLGRQLALAGEHEGAESVDLALLVADLRGLLTEGEAPAPVRTAVDALAERRGNAALCRLIEALYAARPTLGEARFAGALDRIRRTLRRSVDRRMEIAR